MYSPLGSPDLYKSSGNYVPNQSASFSGVVENDQNISFDSNNDNGELIIVPDNSSDGSSSKLSYGNYSYATSTNATTSSSAASYASSESQSYQNLKNGSSGGSAGGGNFASNGGSGGAAGSSVAMTGGGITTLSALTMISSDKSNQYNPSSGGQNPGGDPDASTRIPVPDGWGFLLLLAASYAVIKKKFFTS